MRCLIMNISLTEFLENVHSDQPISIRNARSQEEVFRGVPRNLYNLLDESRDYDDTLANAEIDLVTAKGDTLIVYVWLPKKYAITI